MKILILHRQPTAVAYYRSKLPARVLSNDHEVTHFDLPYWHIKPDKENPKLAGWAQWLRERSQEFDIIMVDRGFRWDEVAIYAGYRHFNPKCRMIVDFDDDFTNVPWWNSAAKNFQSGSQYYEVGLSHLRLSEMTTVSTAVLGDRFKNLSHNIAVAPNHIDPKDWENLPVNPDRAQDPHLYILYGGAAGHYGDLDAVKDGLKAVLDNPPVPIRFICFGAIPAWLHELRRKHPQRILSLPWVAFPDYPQTVAWGGFDLAIAPLADHIFNEAKSNIKWVEAGVQGIPFLCSNIGPYSTIPDGCAIKVDNTAQQWAESLRELLVNRSLRDRLKSRARELVADCYTVQHPKLRELWNNIVETTSTLPRIESMEDTRLPGDPEIAIPATHRTADNQPGPD